MLTLYGVPGWGSAISEIMLAMTREPYDFINVEGFDKPGPQQEQLIALNPLCQVPTLLLEEGGVMTESAAIALMLLDKHPQFAPRPGTPARDRFWRLLVWLVANVYPTFTLADYPERWVESQPEVLKASAQRQRKTLYQWLEQEMGEGPYAFGEEITLLDAYWPVLRCWGPGREWFAANAPKLNAMADAVCGRVELTAVLKANKLL
ncbi:MAG TPA: glutathione S-transferase [Franconibacter pulveris]|nr:glutathione S-transferase [Franconibacter pulveris]